jgi:tetratricopeptide (TPR) repeat protein/DNA-binding CsgD family transcriptional regulator
MKLFKVPLPLLCAGLISIFFSTPEVILGQSTPSEIDELYEQTISLEHIHPDSINAIANNLLKQSLKLDYRRGEVKSKLLAAYYYWNNVRLDTAKHLLNECLDYFNQHSKERNTIDYGITLYYSGLVSHRLQELRLAKKYGLEGLQIFRAINNNQYIVTTLTFLGSVELSLSNYSNALKYFTDAYKTKIETGEPPENYISELSSIANVYQKMGMLHDALHYAYKGLSLSKHYKVISAQINLLNTLGATHSSAGTLDSAFYYFNQCKTIALLHDKPNMAYMAEYNIANTYSNNGRYAESNKITKNLLRNSSNVTPAIKEITNTLLAKNYLRLNQYDSVILIASPLLKVSQKNGARQSAINISEILWHAYEKKGIQDSSFFYLLLHSTLKDSVYNIDNQHKLSTLYAEMETLEKQAEIEALEKDKILQKTKNQNLQIIIIAGIVTLSLAITSIILLLKNRAKKQQLLNTELQTELDKNKKLLHQQALRIIYINNGLIEIEEGLKKMKINEADKQDDVQQILNSINLNKSLDKEWENFNEYFTNVHGTFITKLNTLYPELTTTEIRLASLIKMNLTNREIASIINIEQSSVKMAKYRLKKKLQIPEEQDVYIFLQHLGEEINSGKLPPAMVI